MLMVFFHLHKLSTACREELKILQTENIAMREQLAALDPEFFEQIEDLKHDHHQLKQKYAALFASGV